jgi:DNA-binding CsgD family transcriptional regulator
LAVINLRRAGLSYAQIGDIVGMSPKMVEHYCRNADMRSNSRATLIIVVSDKPSSSRLRRKWPLSSCLNKCG